MPLDLETFLTALYTLIDDIYQAHFAPHRPKLGRPCALSDSEVLTLCLLARWSFGDNHAAMLRYARAHWLEYFPRLTTPSAFGKRLGRLQTPLARLPALIARMSCASPPVQVVDTAGVPQKAYSRRSGRCATGADIGRCGAPRRPIFGFRLMVLVGQDSMIHNWASAPASCEERTMLEGLLRSRAGEPGGGPTGPELDLALGPRHRSGQDKWRKGAPGLVEPCGGESSPAPRVDLLADLGFAGAAWGAHWRAKFGVSVHTPKSWASASRGARVMFSRLRQSVEQAIGALGGGQRLGTLRARRDWSVRARLGALVARHNASVWLGGLFGRGPLSQIDVLSLP